MGMNSNPKALQATRLKSVIVSTMETIYSNIRARTEQLHNDFDIRFQACIYTQIKDLLEFRGFVITLHPFREGDDTRAINIWWG